MRKVRLTFTLVGKSEIWKRKLSPEILQHATNEDTLLYVEEVVANRFGKRALFVANKDMLNYGTYPKYYAAGWFISEEDNPSELVVLDHGETMELATKAMLNSVRNIDWDEVAISI